MSELNINSAGSPIMTLENVGVRFGLQAALLRKKHKDFWALKDVSFKLYRGKALGCDRLEWYRQEHLDEKPSPADSVETALNRTSMSFS